MKIFIEFDREDNRKHVILTTRRNNWHLFSMKGNTEHIAYKIAI